LSQNLERRDVQVPPKTKRDPRGQPSYQLSEAAHYLNVPVSTVRWWALGRDHYAPLILPASTQPVLLSFLNLVELHVLAAIRRHHNVPLPKIRNAIEFLGRRFRSRHPLLARELQTDGLDLFIDYFGSHVNISADGQTAMRSVLEAALRRIERDAAGIPIRLHPFACSRIDDSPSIVVIDPRVSAGRPVIAGTGLATEIIAERFKAGESIEELARDYDRPEREIQEALRCELEAA
jgi:uncharacterized protein (DUF433 family)